MSEGRDNCQPVELLVIGYGNTLRSDDGVGPRVAEAVEQLQLPGVETLICQQLSPEHAEPISRARAVIFVDAAVDAPQEIQLRPLEPGETSQLMANAAEPSTMLALARDVFGHAPRAVAFVRERPRPALTVNRGALEVRHRAIAGFNIALAQTSASFARIRSQPILFPRPFQQGNRCRVFAKSCAAFRL